MTLREQHVSRSFSPAASRTSSHRLVLVWSSDSTLTRSITQVAWIPESCCSRICEEATESLPPLCGWSIERLWNCKNWLTYCMSLGPHSQIFQQTGTVPDSIFVKFRYDCERPATLSVSFSKISSKTTKYWWLIQASMAVFLLFLVRLLQLSSRLWSPWPMTL